MKDDNKVVLSESGLKRFMKLLKNKGNNVEIIKNERGETTIRVRGGWNFMYLFGRHFSMDIVPEIEGGFVFDFSKKNLPLPGIFVASHPSFIRNYIHGKDDHVILIVIPLSILILWILGGWGIFLVIPMIIGLFVAKIAVGSRHTHELDDIRNFIIEARQTLK
ncbi:hypothetical protein L0Y65_04920 [Candidatus Micrarchaeota archaeon]|nr:hypothetical protein [Candidatus Micrarchaeota archaeon]